MNPPVDRKKPFKPETIQMRLSFSSLARSLACLITSFTLAAAFDAFAQNTPIQVAAARSRLYAADAAAGSIGVVEVKEGKLLGSVALTGPARGMALAPDGRFLYAASSTRNAVEAADTATLKVTRNAAVSGKPGCLAVSPDGRRLFVCLEGSGDLDLVDTAPMQRLRSVPLGPGAVHSLRVTPDSTRLIAGADRKLTVVNIRSERAEFSIPLDGAAEEVAVESDRHLVIQRAFVIVGGAKSVDVVDWASRKVTEKLALPVVPTGIAVSGGSHSLWIVAGDTLQGFSLPELKKTVSIPAGKGAALVSCAPNGPLCYVSSAEGGPIAVIDTVAGKQVSSIAVGKLPGRLLVTQ